MSINKVIISGNLTRDAELRQTQGGRAVLGWCVAVNDRRKDPQSGEWKDYPNYIDCTMFGNRAQALSQYLTKGRKVTVAGKLRWSQWEAQDGSKRSKVEVMADEVEFFSDGGQRGQQQQYQQHQQPARADSAYTLDDIPF